MKLDAKFYGEIRKAKNDEPVPESEYVVFLAQDTAFANILPLYRDECVRLGCGYRQLMAVDDMIERVKQWRIEHRNRCKEPDIEQGEALLTYDGDKKWRQET